ncbi:MAG TPA: hypothetical protein PKK69_09000, partial [Ferruginibacter sp.]|nr:hypothetical protein [Ferruginibacter sp.]
DSILQTCIESPCDEILDVLKQDVSPGGQYAEFDNDYQLIDPEINVLSHYTQVTYYDEEGQPAQGEDENGNMVAPSALSLKDFILKFEESWATSLVVYHPEYCYYTWCTMNDESQRYNNMLDLQDDATEAIAAGLFDRNNPLALLDHDPFFQGSGHGVAYYGAMKDDLLQYSGNVLNLTAQSNKDILQTIDFLIYCGNQTPPIDWDNCNKAPNDPCRSSYKEWLLYKEWYLDRKLKYYTAAMHDFLPGCSNCFIPSSNQADPSTFGSCTAPPITDFSIDTIPNSTADGMRRIRIKFRNGDESYNWPLNIQIHMASSGGTLTLDQNIVLTPGFGSQEMLVQSDFDIFQITSVTCAQILTERHGVRNLNKSVAGRVTRQSNKNINPFSGAVLSTIANRVNSSNNVLNPSFGKTSAVSSNAIMPIDWPCPAADDFVMTGLATNTFQICYNGITIPAGHSVTVTV